MNPLDSPERVSQARPSSPLKFHRQLTGAAAPVNALGGRWLGATPQALQAPLLAPAGAAFDAWIGGASLRSGQHGCVHYVTDGDWLHGHAVIEEGAAGVQAISQQVYADLFAVLAATPCTHLLRLWNYLADINAAAPDGTERYRQFNAGRQQAFLDAGRSAFEGAPAACALGTQGGPLTVFFLAGRQAPQAIENPRQVSAYHYPKSYGSRAPTFSRAALADVGEGRQALFISGTASIVGHETLHLGDVRRQTEESLANITAVREAAATKAGHAYAAGDLHYTLYVRDPADLPVIRAVFEAAVGAGSPAATSALYVHADICRAELLVEIEAHGFIDGDGRSVA
jgi:chorismate lyase / 3-hydroxybenzoate synthase